ncbi:MAG: flavin reductase family protein [Dehalococcoidia bacterium]|nr:MAG: flavin reductase family protein [Dehalococcoidia bacterium]
MKKVKLGSSPFICPMPVFLVGANVGDKPNFLTVAWGGIAGERPPMISIAIRHKRYTLKGIKQTGTFSVNIPSKDIVVETDYCGMASGAQFDKAINCHFDIFYGKLLNAPMIEQCPLNLECKLVHLIDLGSHALIIGSIEETHINQTCLTNGKPDVTKIKPFIYSAGYNNRYQVFGDSIAKAFSAGSTIINREK